MADEIKSCYTCKYETRDINAMVWPCDRCGDATGEDHWRKKEIADERDELIAELRAQIERMKCCGNCDGDDIDCRACSSAREYWSPKNG